MSAFETYPVVKFPDAIKRSEVLKAPEMPLLPVNEELSSGGFVAAMIIGIIMVVSMLTISKESITFFAAIANLFGICLIWAKINSSSNRKKLKRYELDKLHYTDNLKRYNGLNEAFELKLGLVNEGYNRPVYYEPDLKSALNNADRPSIVCTSTRGFTEKSFLTKLNKWFPECILIDKTINQYAPDFIYWHKESGLIIDIEIDEPYVAINNKPIHYIGADNLRDSAFTDSNWVVVRFSEEQVHLHPTFCCKFLSDLIIDLIGDVHGYWDIFNDDEYLVYGLKPTKRWTIDEARQLANSGFRQNYLGVNFNQIKSKADNDLPF